MDLSRGLGDVYKRQSLGSNLLSFCNIGFVLLGLSQKFPLLLFQLLDLRLNRIFF
jgi:hypothetical protein